MAKKPTRNKKDPFGLGEIIASQDYNKFLATRSPLDAFASLDTFLVLGINPPPELLDFFNQVFKKYVSHKGAESLDKCFGLVLPGKGNRNLFTQRKQSGRAFDLCSKFWILKTVFGLTLEEAADAVSELPDSLSRWTILDRWKENKEWKAVRELMKESEKRFKSCGENERNYYLKQFPIHSLPPKFQKLHPNHPNNKNVVPWVHRLSFRKSSPK